MINTSLPLLVIENGNFNSIHARWATPTCYAQKHKLFLELLTSPLYSARDRVVSDQKPDRNGEERRILKYNMKASFSVQKAKSPEEYLESWKRLR